MVTDIQLFNYPCLSVCAKTLNYQGDKTMVTDTITIQVTQQGGVTLPKRFGKNYNWQPGEIFVLLEFEDTFILCPRSQMLVVLADYINQNFSHQPLEMVLPKILQQPVLSEISLTEVMNHLSLTAESRGLTPEILEEILNEP